MLGWDYAYNFLLYLQCLVTVNQIKGNTCSINLTSCSIATTSGRIVGDCADSNVYKYYSIPYAKPPTGDLRLEDPVALIRNTSTLVQGKTLPPYCPQTNADNESEDCLYLNIWAPTSLTLSRPVLFWIHGGSNMVGSGSDPYFDGTKFAKSQDVVIVTYNYRLGLLGYFDDNTNTNFAIKDTIMALKWVQDNISRFGGNKGLVTVFGSSSGGTIIRALMSSAKAKGLFQRAIIQSDPQGYGFNKRSFSNGYLTSGFLEALGCSDKSCVKSKSVLDILIAQSSVLAQQIDPSAYPNANLASLISPVIDGQVINNDYWDYVSTGSLPAGVDTIVGFTKDEGNAAINALFTSSLTSTYATQALYYLLGVSRATSLIGSNQYQFSDYTSSDGRYLLGDVASDLFWKCPIQYIARRVTQLKKNNIYPYQLTKGIQYATNSYLPLCTGVVCHQDDIPLTFGNYLTGTSSDLKTLSTSIQSAWAKFAKYGSPQACDSVNWVKSASSSNLNICQLGSSSLAASVNSGKCSALESVQFPFQLS